MLDKEKREILPTLVTKSYVVRRLPTLVAMALVGLGWMLNEIALAWIHERVPRDTPPLPDLWFSWFPEVRGAIRITEYIMLILVINALVVIATHQHRWIVSRRVFFCAALSYCFRALCITIFQVPVPSVNTYCAPKTNGSFYIVSARVARMFWSAGIELAALWRRDHLFRLLFSIAFQLRPRELCGDLIVSGHTLTIFTSFYAFKYYAPKKLKPLSYMLNMLAVMAVLAILFARKHYTIDVVLGYTVSTRVFMEYHSLMLSYHEQSLEKNILSWSWWSKIVPYFEKDAPPPHLFYNRLEWPSNCPQKMRRRIA